MIPTVIVPTVKIVSSRCNLHCRYCYYRYLNPDKSYEIMPIDLLELFFKKTFQFVQKNKCNFVDFVWHGGEPLLAGPNFFEDVMRLEAKFEKSVQIRNNIQTNAVLINKKWATLFKDYDFRVGISLDGPEKYHNSCRVFKDGRGSFRAVMSGLGYLQIAGISPGVIAVITKECLGQEEEFFYFFVENKIQTIHIKPCFEVDIAEGKVEDFSITPDQFVDFLINIFNVWMKHNDPSIKIRNLQQILIGLMGGRPTLCEVSGNCSVFPTVDYDGNIYACDSFPVRKYFFGNIKNNSWLEIIQGQQWQQFVADVKKSHAHCENCEWLPVCHGGCPRYSYSANSDKWHDNLFCHAKKRLLSYLSDYLKSHSVAAYLPAR